MSIRLGLLCPDCQTRVRTYTKRYKAARASGWDGPLVPALGTIRRVRALMCHGHTVAAIAATADVPQQTLYTIIYRESAGKVHRDLAEKITAAYRAMSTTHGQSRYAARTARQALARGWAPPIAWSDPDTDTEPEPWSA